MTEPLTSRKLINALALLAITVGVLVALVGIVAFVVAALFDRSATGAAWVFAIGWAVVFTGAIWYQEEKA